MNVNDVSNKTDVLLHNVRTEQESDAILAQAKRIIDERLLRLNPNMSKDDMQELIRLRLAGEPKEIFLGVYLDSSHAVIAIEVLGVGTVNQCTASVREVIRVALRYNAVAVIIAHNHPSGVCEPSMTDVTFTRRLSDALRMLDMALLDHVIVGRTVLSMARKGLVP
jgi:DNA repair protein RadC